ncbi:MAG: glycoside hydrolase family 88 protein [Phycisphaerae bacterium]|jgi:rhamnogalacturonyl hydrolase YesR
MTLRQNRFDAFLWLVVLQVLTCAINVYSKIPDDVKDVSTLPRVFYLNGAWLAENKVQIQKGDKTLLPAYKQLLVEADESLKTGPFSVMDKTSIPPSGDKHDYMSQGKYWWPNPKTADGLPYVRKDGYVNHESGTGAYDYNRLSSMRNSVETLALAYYFSDEEKYAEHAADLLRIWFIDPNTRMNPNLNFGQGIPGRVKGRGIGIIDTARLISIIDSIGLLESSRHWSRNDQSAMQAWMEEYLNWLRSSPNGRDEASARNNHGTWYDAQVVCFALFVDKPSIAEEVLAKTTKSRIDSQIKPDGRQPYELERTKSLGYSQMNLRGFFTLARLGEHVSVDLWNYRSAKGASLRKALDFLAGYINNPSSWPYKQIKNVDSESIFDLLKWAQIKYDEKIYGQWIEKLPKDNIITKRENLFFMANKKVQLPDVMQPKQIKAVLTAVADWQLNHPDNREKHKDTGWVHAVMFTGMTAWSSISDDVKCQNFLKEVGRKNQWQLGPRIYNADDHCIGQVYLELYGKDKNPGMIAPLRERFDYILANPCKSQLVFNQENIKDRWWWCDSLFMAPPVWTRLSAVTGDSRYIDFMNAEFRLTTDYLYDKQEHLYYRDSRYFTRRENNGKKIFWGRGNGWVIAGLARILQYMPADFPDRQIYVKIYKEMADKIASIQLSDGMWRASLLDPNSYPMPEASCSSLFCYAIAWGINQGILDKQKYPPVVAKAWDGLVKCVHPDGKLGSVQPIGFDPKEVTSDTTDLYGVGAFLLAGTEVYKLSR